MLSHMSSDILLLITKNLSYDQSVVMNRLLNLNIPDKTLFLNSKIFHGKGDLQSALLYHNFSASDLYTVIYDSSFNTSQIYEVLCDIESCDTIETVKNARNVSDNELYNSIKIFQVMLSMVESIAQYSTFRYICIHAKLNDLLLDYFVNIILVKYTCSTDISHIMKSLMKFRTTMYQTNWHKTNVSLFRILVLYLKNLGIIQEKILIEIFYEHDTVKMKSSKDKEVIDTMMMLFTSLK